MRFLDLNAPQRQAVQTINGPVLVLAGAGTGKTRVITSRICHLLDQGVRPEWILAVTFTNKAALEMKERVAKMTAKGVASKLTISTFHSLCVRILRQDIERLGYKRNFVIYTQSDQLSLIRKIINKTVAKGEKLEPEAALNYISRRRNSGGPGARDASELAEVVMREYLQQLKLMNAVDFDDLLILAVRVLEENIDVREAWRARYRYLMVDEFQDTNSLQMKLLRALTGSHRNICVVGDDDQSIYGWRGADISNILEFERFFPNPVIVKLEENYRSTNAILETANSLIRHNRQRREKRLWSGKQSEEKVRVIAMPGEKEEAEFVVEDIMVNKGRMCLEYDDFAVLFRTNTMTRPFEEGLRKNKIPYRIIGGRSFFDRREVKDVLAYLAVLVNPNDDINFLRVVNTPPRGIGDTVVGVATAMSQERGESVYKTLCSAELQGALSAKSRAAVQRFLEFVKRWQDEMTGNSWTTLGDMAARMLEELEYLPWLKRSCKDDQEGAARESGINDLLGSMRARGVRTETDLIDFLASVSLEDDRDSAKDELEKQKGVSLITMHAAKGLEFPHVYLPGLEQGTLPHKRSLEEGSLDEERRLLYVAITRARERLTITWCDARTKWGEKMPCQPSVFLKELDPAHLYQTSWEEMRNRPVSLEEAKDRFSALREMLSR